MTPRPLPFAPAWAAWAVWLTVACNAAGWALSVPRWLSALSLAVVLPLLLCGLGFVSGTPLPALPHVASLKRFLAKCAWPIKKFKRRHFYGLLRTSWIVVLGLVALGLLTHGPNNMDALHVRLPKVGWWLYHGGWEWIPAHLQALNTRSSGMEWVWAPWLAWFGSERALGLFNFGLLLLMPGLCFAIMRHLGAPGRVAAAWMWVLPCGLGFVLQGGGIANDLPATFFMLVSLDSALRWRGTSSFRDGALAVAAAACMTAVKPTTLPLALPLLVVGFGMWRLLCKQPLRAAALCLPMLLASFLPTAIMNDRACGDWTGAAAENPSLGRVRPWVGLLGNLINAPIQNFAPPIFPLSELWNAQVPKLFPEPFLAAMARDFESRAARFGLTDMQGEESAGLGTALCLLLLGSITAAGIWRGGCRPTRLALLISVSCAAALLTYFSRAGMTTVARHILPYYLPLMLPMLTGPGMARVVVSWPWRITALATVATAALMLLVFPSRPVLPMERLLGWASKQFQIPALQQLHTAYSIYAVRADLLADFRHALPEQTSVIGFINHATGPEASLWRPWGRRWVRQLRPNEDPHGVRAPRDRNGTTLPLTYVVVNTMDFQRARGESPQAWLNRLGGTVELVKPIRPLVKEPASEWWLVKFDT